jgi:hypothetical protein
MPFEGVEMEKNAEAMSGNFPPRSWGFVLRRLA